MLWPPPKFNSERDNLRVRTSTDTSVHGADCQWTAKEMARPSPNGSTPVKRTFTKSRSPTNRKMLRLITQVRRWPQRPVN
jgi:hypothetical protein